MGPMGRGREGRGSVLDRIREAKKYEIIAQKTHFSPDFIS